MTYAYKLDGDPRGVVRCIARPVKAGDLLPDENGDPRVVVWVGNHQAPRARILVVEDEEALREIIVAMLRSANYVCRQARGGDDALNVLDSGEEFALVLSNLIIPGLDGIGLLERVKAKYPDLPVVIESTVADASTIRDVMRHGAHDYLLKPFKREELLVAVRRALDNRRPASV
jgi:DNA-binding NtrC family response regulator